MFFCAFIALTLLVEWQARHLVACKNVYTLIIQIQCFDIAG